ncbi:MAG: GIY-YIG nuclease family protein [Candidatus Portnoybacteria bacterium]|nr:GIY-YIG nuclease family protein [Candidatus Portnoybacteria bacterium]
MKQYYVYIITNHSKTLYIGVTSNLRKRVWEHQNKLVEGFTKKYKIDQLVYYEQTNDVYGAIAREKQLKKWRREKKINLIEKVNPLWIDLSDAI